MPVVGHARQGAFHKKQQHKTLSDQKRYSARSMIGPEYLEADRTCRSLHCHYTKSLGTVVKQQQLATQEQQLATQEQLPIKLSFLES